MAQDQFGNYIADVLPLPTSFPKSMFGGLSGSGVPDNALGNNGDTYVNLINGDLYTKSGGSWALSTGGAGPAGGSGLAGSGSPEGVITATAGTTYVNTNAPYDVWFKVAGVGNTGWILKLE